MIKLDAFRKKYDYEDATAIMKQFIDAKYQNQDALLLFRMGDFFELFYEDAKIASDILGIALTKRNKNNARNNIAMCGVPHHALEHYLNKLISEGFKVAICDQLETPEEAKKRDGYKAVIKREVTRVITPGTITEESLINTSQPNYLTCLVFDPQESAICYIDLSTSYIAVTKCDSKNIIDELARLNSKEILISEKYRNNDITDEIRQNLNQYISFIAENNFTYNKSLHKILDFYKIHSVDALGELNENQIISIAVILEYLCLTQKTLLNILPKPKIIDRSLIMQIDHMTRNNLELHKTQDGSVKGSLFSLINHTMSKSGSRLLYNILASPLKDSKLINQRLNITNFFYENNEITKKIRAKIKNISDIKRIISRIYTKKVTPQDLNNLKDTIAIAESIEEDFLQISGLTNQNEKITNLRNNLIGHRDIFEIIDDAIRQDAANTITDGNIIKLEYNRKIKELYDIVYNAQNYINDLAIKYRQNTKIDTLKINHNNVIGLFIDITIRHANKTMPDEFIHKQTTTNSIRYITNELQDLDSKIVSSKHSLAALEKEIYLKICDKILDADHGSRRLNSLAETLAYLDLFCNFAYIAHEYNYVMPKLTNSDEFLIEQGRHPVVELALNKNNENFICNDCDLSENQKLWLITGPNMAGKSTFLRQNAIIAVLAHIGSFVPAQSAIIGTIDKIFARVSTNDNISKNQSTFMVEMIETAMILNQSTKNSLIILDEVGRGTSTNDGLAIAYAVIEYIHDKLNNRCLFATHYHELTDLCKPLNSVANHTVAIDDSSDNVIFLHKIIKGVADKSYGVHVAQIAGLPKSVIECANNLLEKLDNM